MDLETTVKNAGIILGYSTFCVYMGLAGINFLAHYVRKHDLYKENPPETVPAKIRSHLGMIYGSVYESLNLFKE